MAILRCTKKLLTELKTKPSEGTISSDAVGSWHANLLRVDRRKCILFTHDATLYSFLVLGLKKPQFENVREVFGQNLFKNLLWENFPQNQIEIVLDEHREIIIAKTNNRSVLGSMTDLAFQIKYQIGAWKKWAASLKNNIYALYLASRDDRVPIPAKIIIGLVVAYAVSPIDLIPDFIPLIGYLDDLFLLPLGIWLAIRLVPQEVWQECQALAVKRVSEMPRNYLAAAVIVIIWLLAIAGFMLWAWQFVSGIK